MELATLKGSRVLITGGAGMIGSTIAHQVMAQGAQVTILDAMLPLYGGNRFNLRGIIGEVQFIEGDIRDLDLIENTPEIEPVATIQRQHGVQDGYLGPLGHRQMCDGAADHAGAAGDQHPGARERP